MQDMTGFFSFFSSKSALCPTLVIAALYVIVNNVGLWDNAYLSIYPGYFWEPHSMGHLEISGVPLTGMIIGPFSSGENTHVWIMIKLYFMYGNQCLTWWFKHSNLLMLKRWNLHIAIKESLLYLNLIQHNTAYRPTMTSSKYTLMGGL